MGWLMWGAPDVSQKERLKAEEQKELQGDAKLQDGELIARVSGACVHTACCKSRGLSVFFV